MQFINNGSVKSARVVHERDTRVVATEDVNHDRESSLFRSFHKDAFERYVRSTNVQIAFVQNGVTYIDWQKCELK